MKPPASLFRLQTSLRHGRRGSFAMASALMMSLIFGTGMFAFEAARIDQARSKLQSAADAAAMAAARELPVVGGSRSAMNAVARGVAEVNLGIVNRQPPDPPGQGRSLGLAAMASSNHQAPGGGGGNGSPGDAPGLEISTRLEDEGKAVRVELRRHAPMFFGKLVNTANPWIIATATAEVYGETKICIITLKQSEQDGLRMEGSSKIVGSDCGVFVNSRDAAALHMHDKSLIESPTICSAGGAMIEGHSKTSSRPITDCPPQPDPLETRNVRPGETCTHNDKFVVSTDRDAPPDAEFRRVDGPDPYQVLKPGVYCGGIEVGQDVEAWFDPGTYVIRGGPLTFKDQARAAGKGVAFHFTGDDARVEILDDADVKLSAPVRGQLAGILFYENKCSSSSSSTLVSLSIGTSGGTCPAPVEHVIKSPNVKELIGTIYLPNNRLLIDTTKSIAAESAFTVIIVNELLLEDHPYLVLNTDYAATNVPVPEGVTLPLDHVRLSR